MYILNPDGSVPSIKQQIANREQMFKGMDAEILIKQKKEDALNYIAIWLGNYCDHTLTLTKKACEIYDQDINELTAHANCDCEVLMNQPEYF